MDRQDIRHARESIFSADQTRVRHARVVEAGIQRDEALRKTQNGFPIRTLGNDNPIIVSHARVLEAGIHKKRGFAENQEWIPGRFTRQ